MLHLDYKIEILIGGTYSGDNSWSKNYSEIDNCFKIYEITDGELYLCGIDDVHLLKSGNLYFINGNKLVSQFCEKSFSTAWLHFVPIDLMLHHGLLSMPMVVNMSEIDVFSNNAIANVESLLLEKYSQKDRYIDSLRMQSFIEYVIVKLLERHSWSSLQDSFALQSIEPAMTYIKDHIMENITLQQLARRCKMSQSYFHKLFSSTLGSTPTNYIKLLRMSIALSLLSNKDISIK